MHRLDAADWIAADVDGYVARAVRAAAEVEALRAARGTLRRCVLAKLCDARTQADEFARLVQEQWQRVAARNRFGHP
jgi:predicted O-linked N-acetylglucosamine transferase (SPINDLY family)